MENTGSLMSKLKKHSVYKKMSTEEQQELAVRFSSPAEIHTMFSHLLAAGTKMAMALTREDSNELIHSEEFVAHHERVKHGIAQACNLQVKLSLQNIPETKLPLAHSFSSLLKLEYGPFHAALIVGDVTLEWGRASIIEPRFDPRAEADFQALVGDQGDWKIREEAFLRQMSLADRQKNRVEKLDTLYQSMAEKARMINNLVKVIVDYNCNKEYSVFHCNCQHFARDAMAALNIRKPVQFQGLLQARFEQLKRGRIRVQPEVRTHENLDMQVDATLDQLSRQDMEYFQCLYFDFHLQAIDKCDDPDNWQCDIPTCKSNELDIKIRERTLSFNQYLPVDTAANEEAMNPLFDNHTIVPENVFGAAPDAPKKGISEETPLAAVAEEEEEEEEEEYLEGFELVNSEEDAIVATGFMSMDLEEQAKLAAKFSGYREEVLLKYREHPQHDEKNEDEMIDVLTEEEPLHQRFFNAFVDRSKQCILKTTEDHYRYEKDEITWKQASDNTRERFDKLSRYPLRLIYSVDVKHCKSRKPISDTPLKVSLQVDDLILEWRKPGLVIPIVLAKTLAEAVTVEHIVLLQDLSKQSQWSELVDRWRAQIDTAIANKEESSVISIMYDISQKREQLTSSLVQLIVRYNRYSHYHKKQCNNVQFILEAMQQLEVINSSTPCTSLSQYLKVLPSNTTTTSKDHPQLDSYVFENVGSHKLGEEIELLVSKYFVFHMESWKTVGKRKRDWTCPLESCQLMNLLGQINEGTV